MARVSGERKIIFRAALAAFGGAPSVFRYLDDNGISSVDIVSSPDRPVPGATSHATIGLSEHPIGLSVGERPLRAEIVGAAYSEAGFFANVLATCAFQVINSQYSCYPGAMYTDVIRMYRPRGDLAHVLFVTPFLWGEALPNVRLPDRVVAWLQAIPISENEWLFAREHGSDALESLFEERQIDVFDLSRASTI